MSSHHRFLQRSITHVSFRNRLTEEETMWRRREQEQDQDNKQRYRSRSPYQKRQQHTQKHRSPIDQNRKQDCDNTNQAEVAFGPPLPCNLGINADRWDHAFFMQRYPKEYEKQINQSKQEEEESASSEDEKKKRKHSKHRSRKEENRKKTKRRHRSRS